MPTNWLQAAAEAPHLAYALQALDGFSDVEVKRLALQLVGEVSAASSPDLHAWLRQREPRYGIRNFRKPRTLGDVLDHQVVALCAVLFHTIGSPTAATWASEAAFTFGKWQGSFAAVEHAAEEKVRKLVKRKLDASAAGKASGMARRQVSDPIRWMQGFEHAQEAVIHGKAGRLGPKRLAEEFSLVYKDAKGIIRAVRDLANEGVLVPLVSKKRG